MSYNQTDERMKEQILLEALIVHIVEPNPSYCDHSVHSMSIECPIEIIVSIVHTLG
jgi:hypothetical protein